MRRIGLALLAALAGCNQVFGIKDTVKKPDAADPEFTGMMRWAAAKTVNGVPMGVDVFPIGNEAIDSAPLVLQIGPALGMGDLADAPYDVSTGTFQLGFRLAGQPWRLVYKLPNDPITHEIQWSVQTPDLVIPRTTRMGAMVVPTDASGYDITPTPTANFAQPFVATSGAFLVGVPGTFTGTEAKLTIKTDATAINGPVSAPDASDWIFVGDTAAASATATQLTGWAVARNVSLGAGLTPVQPTWNTGGLLQIKPTIAQQLCHDRLAAALGTLAADDSSMPWPYYPHMTYGISPNLDVYGFVEPPVDCGTPVGDASASGVDCLPRPAMIPLADDSAFDLSFQAPGLDTVGIQNPPVMYARYTQTRPIHGVALTSAIQSLAQGQSPATSGEMINVISTSTPTAALCDEATLDNTIDLSGARGPVSMDVDVPMVPTPRKLTFHPRLGADGAPLATADDFIITLYSIQNADTPTAKLHAVRVFHITDYTVGVGIDPSLLTPGLYVFSITSRIGFPMAAKGDFKTVSYPIGASTVFTRQFHVH
jgi:hypothetical protein